MKKRLSLVFAELAKTNSKKAKLNILRENDSPALQTIFKYMFDPNIQWLLPEGAPPYKQFKNVEEAETILYSEVRKLYLFVKGGNDSLKQSKRETLFIQMLEMLHPEDAELIINVKDKKVKGITSSLIKEAYPTLIPDLVERID